MENNILKQRAAVRANIFQAFNIEKGVATGLLKSEEEVSPFEYEEWKNGLTKAEFEEFEKAKRNDGDIHPNGKWVWRASANGGKGDWRVIKNSGRKTATTSASKTLTTDKQSSETKKNGNTSSLSLKEKRELRKKIKESPNFASKMENEVVKHFGAELKKKYGSDDFSDIYDKVGEDKFDDVFMSYVYRLYKKE